MESHSSPTPDDRLGTNPTDSENAEVYQSRKHRRYQERLVDGMNRDQACRHYERRIMLVARRISERLPSGCELGRDDLVSCGAIGLLEAFDRFDETRGIQFSTFAEYRIRGAMMDTLRASDSFSRYRRQMARRIQYTTQELTMALGQPPEPEQVAAKLDMDMESYWSVMDRITPVSYVSIDDTESPEGEGNGRAYGEALMATDGLEAFRAILGHQSRLQLKDAIKGLPERKRQCILLYYGRGLNLTEVAQVFNVTPSRISQILSGARSDLKKALEGILAANDVAFSEAM